MRIVKNMLTLDSRKIPNKRSPNFLDILSSDIESLNLSLAEVDSNIRGLVSMINGASKDEKLRINEEFNQLSVEGRLISLKLNNVIETYKVFSEVKLGLRPYSVLPSNYFRN